MNANAYIENTEEGTERYRIESKAGILSPSFIPEIKGAEDLLAILNNSQALDDNNPVMMPGYVWNQIRYRRVVEDRQMQIDLLEEGYPFLFYEPVELFRYKRPHQLVSYAFKSQDANRSNFDAALRNGDIEAALDRLDDFFAEFARANLVKLAKKVVGDDGEVPRAAEIYEWGGKTVDVWPKLVGTDALEDYFRHIVNTASGIPDTYIITPVFPLTESVDDKTIDDLITINNKMLFLCNESNETIRWGLESSEDKLTRPYFHLYVDRAFIDNTYKSSSKFSRRIQAEIDSGHYAGLALTLSKVNTATDKLDSFVNDMVNIAKQNNIPVVCPRSPWKGLYLADLGVNGYSGLLRSLQEYQPKAKKGGASIPKENQYSSIPDISTGKTLGIKEVYEMLRTQGSLNDIGGLPTYEDKFVDLGPNIDDSQLDNVFRTPRKWRINIGKPHWFELVELARQVRQGKSAGEMEPGKSILEDMEHDFVQID